MNLKDLKKKKIKQKLKKKESFFSKLDYKIIIANFLRFILILTGIYSIIDKNWIVFFYCLFIFILTFIPIIVKKKLKINIPLDLEFLYILFIYTSIFLGEVKFYFLIYWWWDIFLHFFSGIALGFIGVILIYIIYSQNEIKNNYLLLSIFAFSFAICIGTIWEIFEFVVDQIFGTNMQKSGLVDTMFDLIINTIGAFITSIFAYFYFKFNHKNRIGRFIGNFVKENPKLYYK
jgi:hypothetical protein